jgi:hypothetical protein
LLSKGTLDPFGGAKPRLLSRGKEEPLRVNSEQAQAFRPGSRRVDSEKFLWRKGGEISILKLNMEIISKFFELPKPIFPVKYD